MATEAEGMHNTDRYTGIKPEIANILRDYEFKYFRWDKEVPFCGLYIYPARMKDYETFYNCSSCLTLNRKEDPAGLRMNNLDYLIYKMSIKENDEGNIWSYKFQKLCEIVFHIDNGLKCSKCGKVLSYDSPTFINFVRQIQELAKQDPQSSEQITPKLLCPDCQGEEFTEMIKIVKDPETQKGTLIINGQKITAKDFDLLRQIVLYQNFSDYADDSWIDPDIKADYEARMQLQQKQNKLHATLERKMVCLSIATSYTLEYIYTMTIRKFTMALGAVDDLIDYKITKTAMMSGFIKVDKKQVFNHWIYREDKDLYGDAYKDMDEVKSEVNNL